MSYKNEIIKFQCNLFLWSSHSTSSIVFFSIFFKNKIPVLNIPIPPYSLLFIWKWNSNILSFRFHPFTPCMLVICDPFCIFTSELFWSPFVRRLSVRLSVCLSVCTSVTFSYFRLLLKNHWVNFNQTWHKAPLGKGDSSLLKRRAPPFSKGI